MKSYELVKAIEEFVSGLEHLAGYNYVTHIYSEETHKEAKVELYVTIDIDILDKDIHEKMKIFALTLTSHAPMRIGYGKGNVEQTSVEYWCEFTTNLD